MSEFVPGEVVAKLESKDEREVIIRYPEWSDLPAMMNYINTLSKEDTYISFSGEQMSLKDEAQYLSSQFVSLEMNRSVNLLAWVGNVMAGYCNINIDTSGRERSKHTAIFGISVAKDYRGVGIGKLLAQTTMDEARTRMSELRLITLTHFGENEIAHSLYTSLGFVEHGRLPDGYVYKDEFADKVYMHYVVDE